MANIDRFFDTVHITSTLLSDTTSIVVDTASTLLVNIRDLTGVTSVQAVSGLLVTTSGRNKIVLPTTVTCTAPTVQSEPIEDFMWPVDKWTVTFTITSGEWDGISPLNLVLTVVDGNGSVHLNTLNVYKG